MNFILYTPYLHFNKLKREREIEGGRVRDKGDV